MKEKALAIITTAMLLAALGASGQIWQGYCLNLKQPSNGLNIDTNLEYSNGTIGSPNEDLFLWYAWISTGNIQTIFLAYQSYRVNPPIVIFLGQHYFTQNNTEVLVGNTLNSMEVYNDTNGNGLPDADYTAGTSEILYEFLVNSSVSFTTTPIQRILKDGQYHYTWEVRYNTIDGFMIGQGGYTDAMVIIDYMDFSYDFYVQNNVSYVKTNFGMGTILQSSPFYADQNSSFTLDNLSLALFYGTTVITAKPYVTLVNGTPYNSTTATPTVQPADYGEIRIDDSKAYEFLFGQNYSLFSDSQPEIHRSTSTAISTQSVSSGFHGRIEWILQNLEDTLSGLFPKTSSMQVAIDLDYDVSSFLYRVCYPVWSGFRLQHDPTYIAYLAGVVIPELNPPLMLIVMAAVVSATALVAALVDMKKTSKMLKQSDKIASETAI